jgi:hypothetical protein
MQKLVVLFAVGMWLLLAVPASAVAKSPFYFALAVGQAEMGEADAIGAAVHDSLLAHYSLTSVAEEHRNLSQSEFAFSVTGGASFGRYVSTELTYFYLKPTTYAVSGRSRTSTGDEFAYSQDTKIGVEGFGVSLIGRWPIRPRWQVYGRAGAFNSRVKADGFLCGGLSNDCGAQNKPTSGLFFADLNDFGNTSGGGNGVVFESTGTSPFVGLGLLFGGDSLGLRLEYSAFRVRTPRDANAERLPNGADVTKPPLANVSASAATHSLSLGFYYVIGSL